jgi:hypothetical protein
MSPQRHAAVIFVTGISPLSRLLPPRGCGYVDATIKGGSKHKTKDEDSMKMKLHITEPNGTNGTFRSFHPRPGKLRRTPLLGAAAAGILLAIQPVIAQPVGNVFVIAMENHNFVQPNPTNSPQQIFGNPAAPYINSLITAGNPNAVQVAYSMTYYNAGNGVHPSEPNYVWAEAGTDFGVHTDADPRSANGNTFYDTSPHLTAQLNTAGVLWKNYQEDVQLSTSPTNSASGTNGPINPYYGTTQYNYAVKHNPMAFFADTAVQNVYPLAQLFTDLNNDTVGRYTWITPNQFDDAHSALTGGFTYNGTHYTGDQAAVALGDNFLSQVIPQIMASPAYQSNGVIIIWWDETEGGDTASRTIPEIIISPLSKGNAYASTVPMNHSSDIKTIEEILDLGPLTNSIPATETNIFGGYNDVATVNDLSDLFQPGTIPVAQGVTVARGGYVYDRRTQLFVQQVQLTNTGTTPVSGPVWLVLDTLSANASLYNAAGTTANFPPLGSPYIGINIGGDNVLSPGETATVMLEFTDPTRGAINYTARVLSGMATP